MLYVEVEELSKGHLGVETGTESMTRYRKINEKEGVNLNTKNRLQSPKPLFK